MRVKKLLPLILLAVGAVFLLSSCDAILDAIYANNTINVTVEIPNAYPGYNNPYSYVTVTLGGASGATESVSVTNPGLLASYGYYYLPSMKKLPNGNYSITTQYYDASNGNTYQVSDFYDPGNNLVTSMSLPYGGSNTANVVVLY